MSAADVDVRIVGPSGDPKDEKMRAHIQLMGIAMRTGAMKLGLTVGDSMATTLCAVAEVAEEYEFRSALADVMERWAQMLRSSAPIKFRAEDIGHA